MKACPRSWPPAATYSSRMGLLPSWFLLPLSCSFPDSPKGPLADRSRFRLGLVILNAVLCQLHERGLQARPAPCQLMDLDVMLRGQIADLRRLHARDDERVAVVGYGCTGQPE